MSYFVAEYSTVCDSCEERITPGQKIGWANRVVVHASCIERGRSPKKAVEVCKVCWLEKPCGCEDGQ